MLMRFKYLGQHPCVFRSVAGLTIEEFDKLLVELLFWVTSWASLSRVCAGRWPASFRCWKLPVGPPFAGRIGSRVGVSPKSWKIAPRRQ